MLSKQGDDKMDFLNSFKNRQYQLTCCYDESCKRRSLKSRKVRDLFIKKIAYSPMYFRNTGRYPIENRQYTRMQIKLLKELHNKRSA